MQIQAGYQWTQVGTVGTVLLTGQSGAVLRRVVVQGTYVGTLAFYDTNAIAGTTNANAIGTFGLPATSVAGAIDIEANCKQGLVYVATGWTSGAVTIIWDG